MTRQLSSTGSENTTRILAVSAVIPCSQIACSLMACIALACVRLPPVAAARFSDPVFSVCCLSLQLRQLSLSQTIPHERRVLATVPTQRMLLALPPRARRLSVA